MTWTYEEIAGMIDHSLLNPVMTDEVLEEAEPEPESPPEAEAEPVVGLEIDAEPATVREPFGDQGGFSEAGRGGDAGKFVT